MRIAIPVCEGGISPVFDVAKHMILVDVESGQETTRTEVSLENSDPDSIAQRIVDLGADTLICGAISLPLESYLLSTGVDVIPLIDTPLDDGLIPPEFPDGGLDRSDRPGYTHVYWNLAGLKAIMAVAVDGRSARLKIDPLADRTCEKVVVHLGGLSEAWADQPLDPSQKHEVVIPIKP